MPVRLINPKSPGQQAVLRKLGFTLAAVGTIFMAVGFVDYFSAFGGSNPPSRFWCFFVGMPLLFFGMVMLKFGYMGAVATGAKRVRLRWWRCGLSRRTSGHARIVPRYGDRGVAPCLARRVC